MKASLMASASSFAHLLGRTPKAAKAEDEDDKKPKGAKEDEEKGDGDDEGDGPNDGKGKKAKAEGGDRDDDDKRDDDKEKEDAKKAKGNRAEGDDDDEEGDDGSDGADMRKKGARSARMRERTRCAAIFSDAAAGKNPALAAQLAFGTDLPRSQAVSVLRTGGLAVASRPSLDQRMATVNTPVVGPSDAAATGRGSPATNDATAVIVAGMKRRGESTEAIAAFLNTRR